jgi:hypothetical protein
MHFKQNTAQRIFMALLLAAVTGSAIAGVPAQDSASRFEYHMNMTAFVKQFLPLNNFSAFSANPYMISFKKNAGHGKWKRYKLNFCLLNGGGDERSNNRSLELGAGKERRYSVDKHLFFYTAVDIELGYFRNPFFNNDPGLRTGASGCIGLMYRISQRITLSTEASLSAYLATPNYRILYRSGSEVITEPLDGFGLRFLKPDFINLGISF